MSYSYQTERPWLFTEQGSLCFIQARDAALKLLAEAGAFMSFAPLRKVSFGDTWKALAILDRLVEIGDVREVTDRSEAGQNRVFVAVSK